MEGHPGRARAVVVVVVGGAEGGAVARGADERDVDVAVGQEGVAAEEAREGEEAGEVALALEGRTTCLCS